MEGYGHEEPLHPKGEGLAGLAQMAKPGSEYYSMERRGSAGRDVLGGKLQVGMEALDLFTKGQFDFVIVDDLRPEPSHPLP